VKWRKLCVVEIRYRVYCLIGDGESAEGSVWEALHFASNYRLDNLVAIFDINRLGQSEATSLQHDMDTYQRRLTAFGLVMVCLTVVFKPGMHWWQSWIQHGRLCGMSTVSLWPHTHWLQSRKDVRHLDDKVDQVGDDADRDKLSNLSCCLFVAKTGDKSQPYRQQGRPYWRQSILSPAPCDICQKMRRI